MKKPNFFLLSLVFSIFLMAIGHAQNIHSKHFHQDTILRNFMETLAPNWTVYIVKDSLIIEYGDTVWSVFENKINADAHPFNESVKDEAYYRKIGKPGQARLVYKIENKWTDSQLKKARERNNAIFKQVSDSAKHFGLDHILSKPSKDEYYTGYNLSKKEREALQKFNTIRDQLEMGLIRIPDYYTQFFSVTFINSSGIDDSYTTNYPIEISEEMYRLLNVILNTFFKYEEEY